MLVNHEQKIIAIAVPKTGSTSLYHGLMHHTGQRFHLRSADPAVYHLTARDTRLILGAQTFGSYFSSGVVRNPYDRLVSLYHDFKDHRGQIHAKTFQDFVLHGLAQRWGQDVHFRPQTYFLTDDDRKLLVSKVYRFESGVAQILADIGQRVGFEVQQVGHARKSSRGAWQDYYSNAPAVVKVVQEVYGEDFDAFGYDRAIS